MGVQFVLGKESVDHQKPMLRQLEKWQQTDPDAQFFYLVPEHIKFESEVAVLKYLQKDSAQIYASTKVQVLSFTRLAWFFLRDSAVLNRQNLSQTGLTMLVSHLLNSLNKKELIIFSEEQHQTGFAAKLAQQLVELRLGGFEPDDLENLITAANQRHQTNLAGKLTDLQLVYTKFLDYKINGQLILDTYLDSSKLLKLLTNYLVQTYLSHQYFLISGFDEFNAQELKIITLLMDKAKEVMISLPLTDLASKKMPRSSELFYRPAHLYHQLIKATHNKDIKVLWPHKSRVNQSFQQLEDYWIDAHQISPLREHKLTTAQKDDLQVVQMVDRINEVKWVAGQIRRMIVQSQKDVHPYSYSDFNVLTPALEKYQNLIEPVFSQYEIPLFTDMTQTMASHPLVEFILALFDIQTHGFEYQSLMRFLKTELFVPTQLITGDTLTKWLQKHPLNVKESPQEMEVRQAATYRNTLDVVENYLLANGINTKEQWRQEWIVCELYAHEGESPAELAQRERQLLINRNANLLRKQVVELFDWYEKNLKKVTTGRQFAVLLFELLEKAHVSETLQRWQQAAITILNESHQTNEATLHGNAVDPGRPQQVWDVFCQLLDEYVLALGDEKFDKETFIDIFQNGFESATYKRVPSTLDQVIFSTTSTLQMKNRKVTFIIGATDDVMPQHLENQTLLSEDERKVINETLEKTAVTDKFLPTTCELKMSEEPFSAYRAFMSASQKLIFTYPLNDSANCQLNLSPYVRAIQQTFNLPLKKIDLIPPTSGPEIINYIGTPLTTMTELLNVCCELQRLKERLSPTWQAIYNYLEQLAPIRLQKVLRSLSYQNEILPTVPVDQKGHKKLDQCLVDQLYGNQIFGSISRLETFFKNPYEYFLKYGLKLTARKVFEPTTANVGDYFHDAVAALIRELQHSGQTLTTVTTSQFKRILEKVINEVAGMPEFKVFDQTARNRYLKRRLANSTRKISQALYRQHKHRQIYTLQTETPFGFGTDALLKGKTFTTPTGKVLKLQGRLDRIDLITDQQQQFYYNVTDYKSGTIKNKLTDFLVKAYSGISLQLLTYLAILRDDQQGLLDLLIHNKVLQKQIGSSFNDSLTLGSAIYFHLGTPQLDQTTYSKIKNVHDAFKTLDKQFIYDGIFLGRQGKDKGYDYIKALGTLSGQSALDLNNYNIALTNKGIPTKSSQNKIYNLQQFNTLLDMVLKRIEEATNNIFNGVIDLKPYKLAKTTGLDYSDYLPIMSFDPLVGNEYRDLTVFKELGDQLWQRIAQELGKKIDDQGGIC